MKASVLKTKTVASRVCRLFVLSGRLVITNVLLCLRSGVCEKADEDLVTQ